MKTKSVKLKNGMILGFEDDKIFGLRLFITGNVGKGESFTHYVYPDKLKTKKGFTEYIGELFDIMSMGYMEHIRKVLQEK